MLTLEDFGVSYHEATLSNGLRVVLFERPHAPIALRVVLFAGGRFDPLRKEGLAHFTEHMILGGTKQFPTREDLGSYIEMYGGTYGASTGTDVMSVHANVGDPKDIQVPFDILRGALCEPLFNADAIETERGVIRDELRREKANPASMIGQLWRRLLFQSTELGRPILGTEESLQTISKQDIENFHARLFHSGNAAVLVGGGIGMQQLCEILEQSLVLPRGVPFVDTEQIGQRRDAPVIIESYPGIEQIHLVFGFRTVPLAHKDYMPLHLLSGMLANGRISVLRKRLRNELGLVYGESAYTPASGDSGAFFIKTATTKVHVQQVLDVITREIIRIADDGVSEDQLEHVKNRIIKSRRLDMQTSSDWVDFHGYGTLFRHDQWTLVNFLSEIAAVTPEDIQRVVKTYFSSGKWYLGMCGDITEQDVRVNW